jgi:hypothetical protein
MTPSNDIRQHLAHCRIQHFDESPCRRNTAIARGGYGILNEDGHAPLDRQLDELLCGAALQA